MGHQCYIKCDDYYLFACVYFPEKYNRVVLLLQGYSHAMTDVDYFMTNIKNELLKKNLAVVQFDPYGHGDSDGELEKFTSDILIKNIIAVASWIKKNISEDIIFFTRGLFCLTSSNRQINDLFVKKIYLNDLLLTSSTYNKILSVFGAKKNTQEFSEWFDNIPIQDKETMESFFYILGAKLKNLQGQRINFDSFIELIKNLCEREYYYDETNFFIFSSGVDDINIYNGSYEVCTYDINYYYKYNALPRDPDWHYIITTKISSMCL